MYSKGAKFSVFAIVSIMIRSALDSSSSHAEGLPPAKGGKNDIMVYSHPIYLGESSMELDSAGYKVAEYLDKYSNVFSGQHYTRDRSQISVSIAKPNDVAVQGVRDLIAKLDPENRLFLFENVERSREELRAIQMSIVYEFMIDDPEGSDRGLLARIGTSIQSAAVTDSPSRVLIDVLRDSKGTPLEDNAEVQAINAKYPGAVMFTEVTSEIKNASSHDDVTPH